MTLKMDRKQYADMFGPTTGDRVRLADTELFIEVEKDFTRYGDEVKFGGGKVIRDGMGQSARATRKAGALDVLITNAVVLDHQGVRKADIGIRDGRICGIGKAGNPDLMDGVTPSMVIGAATEVIAGEGLIATPGGIDTHIHFICPQQIEEAIAAGVTTMIGGGTGPATGTNATTCAPGDWNIHRMLEAAESFPMNLGFLGKGNCSSPEPLREQIEAGAIGSSSTRTGARPVGHRHLPFRCRRIRCPGGHPHGHPERSGVCRRFHRRLQGQDHPHVPHGRRRRRARPGPSSGCAAYPTYFLPPPIPLCPSPSTPWTSTSICSWCAIISIPVSRKTSHSPIRGSVRKPSPPKTSSTTWGPSA